jgi:hypothetical protein
MRRVISQSLLSDVTAVIVNQHHLEEAAGGGAEIIEDLWFIISKHILPQDVSSFASICKITSEVLSKPQFWLCPYERY